MKSDTNRLLWLLTVISLFMANESPAQIDIPVGVTPGSAKPILVSLSGITGEAAQVLQFDLYIQGFAFTNAEAAQYLISGTSGANLQAAITDKVTKNVLLSRAYSGAILRRQAHALADDFVKALDRKPICQGSIAFKGASGRGSEIYVADFDGFGAQAVTQDGSIVYAPDWVPGHRAIYYGSYRLNRAAIYSQDVLTGARSTFGNFGGSAMSAAVSPDGRKVAVILSKDGWPDLYVCDSDGTNPKRLTKSRQDESSPCWSPDGKWICFAGKERERRGLCKISSGGGDIKSIPTGGVPSPTEPAWSPDGKWIAFTAQYRNFQLCVVPATGGTATTLVEGEDPSWAPNSRTLVFCRRQGTGYVLSLLDVPTKQYKDVSRISGSNSQSQPSWAR